MANGGQRHRCDAATLTAIRISAELARCNLRSQIGRYGLSSSCKDALLWTVGWTFHLSNQRFRHVENGIRRPQSPKVGYHRGSLLRRQDLWIDGPTLRSKKTEPHLHNLGTSAPKLEKFIQVARAPGNLRCDRAVNGDSCPFDVLKDAFIGSWFAPRIVLWLEAVDRYHNIQFLKCRPVAGDDPESTRDDLRVDAALLYLRQQQLEFPIPHQRIAADKRHVNRFVFIDERKHSRDQLISLEIRKLT
jgi:hypothetical protein